MGKSGNPSRLMNADWPVGWIAPPAGEPPRLAPRLRTWPSWHSRAEFAAVNSRHQFEFFQSMQSETHELTIPTSHGNGNHWPTDVGLLFVMLLIVDREVRQDRRHGVAHWNTLATAGLPGYIKISDFRGTFDVEHCASRAVR